MIFKQLIESESSTYTYLLASPETRQAILIDPVLETVERDIEVLRAMNLQLAYTVETHLHADHITGALRLKQKLGSRIAVPAMDRLDCADLGLEEGIPLQLGAITLEPLHTPGHTATHHAYLLRQDGLARLFSGDALLIDACGRTDFQSGDAGKLYDSIHGKFFSLPSETLVYPAHDYEGRFVSTIAQEMNRNPRLGGGKGRDEFIAIMNNLNLPYPRKIDYAVPGNQLCGRCPDNVPEGYRERCLQG